MIIKRWVQTILVMVALVFYKSPVIYGQEVFSLGTSEEAYAVLVLDNINGQILFDHQGQDPIEVGDLTKILTLYLVYQAVDRGDLALDTPLAVSQKAYQVSQDYDINNVPLRRDKEYTVAMLLEAVWLASANGATLALVEGMAGSESDFVQQMQAQAQAWGFDQAEIYNATGLPGAYMAALDLEADSSQASPPRAGDNNRMPAELLATAAYHLLDQHPDLIQVTQQGEGTFDPGTVDAFDMTNANLLLEGKPYAYEGATGLLADDSQAMNHILAMAQRNQLDILVCLLNVPDYEDMYETARQLLNTAFTSYRREPIAHAGDPVKHVGQIPIIGGVQETPAIVYQEDLVAVLPLEDTAPQMDYDFQPNYEYFTIYHELSAPVPEGAYMGQIIVSSQGFEARPVAQAPGNVADLVLAESIEEASWLRRQWVDLSQAVGNSWEAVRRFFTNLFN